MNDQSINSYRDLRVWQDAMTLAESCYRLPRQFPRDDLFGLTSQIRRAAGSIPAERVEILPTPELQAALVQCEGLGKMVGALIRSLQDKSTK